MEKEFWAVAEDQERLTAITSDEAFDEYIDNFDPPEREGMEHYNPQPETMTALQYKPMKVSLDSIRVLEDVLEALDEEHGDPESNGSDGPPTDKMEKAAAQFCKIIEAEYVAWNCEQTGETVTVNTAEWVRENE